MFPSLSRELLILLRRRGGEVAINNTRVVALGAMDELLRRVLHVPAPPGGGGAATGCGSTAKIDGVEVGGARQVRGGCFVPSHGTPSRLERACLVLRVRGWYTLIASNCTTHY